MSPSTTTTTRSRRWPATTAWRWPTGRRTSWRTPRCTGAGDGASCRPFPLRTPGALAGYVAFGDALIGMAGDLDPAHPELAPQAELWDGQSLQDFAATQTLDAGAELLVQSDYRGNYNAQFDQVSLLFVLQQSVVDEALPESGVETMRIAAGNSALPEAMARDLGTAVRLDSPVTKIEQHSWGVRVHAGARHGGTHHGGRCTSRVGGAAAGAPGGLVRPSASTSEVAAMIDELDLGHALKVSTQYDRRFWLSEGLSGFTITDLPFGVGWDATDSMPGGAERPGVLTQFVTGDAARSGAALGDRTRITSFQRQLDVVYPEGRLQQERHRHHHGLGRRALHGRWLRRVRPRADDAVLAAAAPGARRHLVCRRTHRDPGGLHGERRALGPPGGRGHRAGAALNGGSSAGGGRHGAPRAAEVPARQNNTATRVRGTASTASPPTLSKT